MSDTGMFTAERFGEVVDTPKLFESEFFDTLRTLRSEAQGTVDSGRRFERLMKKAFETHPSEYGSDRFKKVWLWSEWPHRTEYGYGQDIGIDLVGEQTDVRGGGLCAIQCKNYAEDHKVPTKDINSFLATSEDARFTSRILVITSDLEQAGWTKITNASKRCEVVGPAILDAWDAPWRDFLDNPDDFKFDPVKKHTPRPDQREALDGIANAYEHGSQGRVIMPCGTGKSVVSMWAAEENVRPGGTVLYLVPSIALMGQTMREWARHRTVRHTYFGICSDTTTGRRTEDKDAARDLMELSMPVSTDREAIADALERTAATPNLRVVFSTYQSLPTLVDVLEGNDPDTLGLGGGFDFVICDEAHRTTGVETSTSKESAFRLVHDNEQVPAKFRMFMTATQRIYTDAARDKALKKYGTDVYSMDDEALYGPILYEMSFSEAIDRKLLSDYEVLVVATSDSRLTETMSSQVAALNAASGKRQVVQKEDAVKLLGVWDAFANPATEGVEPGRATGQLPDDRQSHLNTAIAFTNKIAISKAIAGVTGEECGLWQDVIKESQESESDADQLKLWVNHMDGSTPAIQRAAQLAQLRGQPENGLCRVITNARVLTEGVDVPALDAIVFLQRRTSKIDIVQAVGRVMRRHPDKAKGYVVIPVVVPEGGSVTDTDVLNGSDFDVVWDVVRALRSHDERVDVWVNNIDAAKNNSPVRLLDRETDQPVGPDDIGIEQLRLMLDNKIASKMVDTCGDKKMWPTWGARAAKVCREVRKKVDKQLEDKQVKIAFSDFVEAMRSSVGDHLSTDQAAEMVAHHVVTIPIFDCLFEGSEFAKSNPISAAMNDFLAKFSHVEGSPDGAALARLVFEDELKPLNRAYTTMSTVFEGAVTPAAKVDVLREIYDGFFQAAMKDAVGRLGIVYTPVEIVDFIIRSADAVCRKHFGQGLTDESVNVLDPFAGTGTFIYRLLTIKGKDGNHIIRDNDLLRKYFSELHANELVLLAYYIAAIKIEAGMAERDGFAKGKFAPFSGITFGDTFLNTEAVGRLPGLSDNTARKSRQGSLPIRAIIMNPPWSAGQKSTGDDNPNIDYPELVARVRETYGKWQSLITGKSSGGKSAGNLYVQSIRWASDRLDWPEEGQQRPGIIALVHPNSLTDGTSLAGMRAALRDEFDYIYVVNVKGDAYKTGEAWKREGDKIFGQGSRNGVQITVLVRKGGTREAHREAELFYVEVPDSLKLRQKLDWLEDLGDASNPKLERVPIVKSHDWVNLSDGTFDLMIPVCSTDRKANKNVGVVVSAHAQGVNTAADSYVYAFSKKALGERILDLLEEYDSARRRVHKHGIPITQATVNTPSSLHSIKWTDRLKQSLRSNQDIRFDEKRIREVLYRPFMKMWLYEDDRILNSVKTVSAMFPRPAELSESSTPPPQNSQSRRRATETSSRSSLSEDSSISTSSGRIKAEREAFPERDNSDKRRIKHDGSSAGYEPTTGLGVNPRFKTDKNAAQNESINNPTRGGVLLTDPTNRAVFAILATPCLSDLSAAGQTSRPDASQRNDLDNRPGEGSGIRNDGDKHPAGLAPSGGRTTDEDATSLENANLREGTALRPLQPNSLCYPRASVPQRHQLDNQSTSTMHPKTEAIVMTDASKQVPFGVIASSTLMGLHVTGRESRTVVRKVA